MKLSNNLSFESILASYEAFYNCEYNDSQKKQLEFGYEDGINVSKYANPEFNYLQMNFIRNGLVKNLEVDKYAFVQYNHVIMSVIYHLLENGAHFNKYIIEDHLDVDKLISDYELLIRYKGLSRLDKWAIDMIYDGAPYYVKQ